MSREYNIGVTEEMDKTQVPIELLLLAMVEIGIFQVEFSQIIFVFFSGYFSCKFFRQTLPPAQKTYIESNDLRIKAYLNR